MNAPDGVWAHLAQAPGRTVLHVVADTGTKSKKLQTREQFAPAGPVEARIRVNHPVKKAWRLTDGQSLKVSVENGHAILRLDQVTIHEAIVLE